MRIAVIGAGNSGLAMAAFMSANGHHVVLWNRSYTNLGVLAQTNVIRSSGCLNGDFAVQGVTDNMEEAVKNAELILVTTPATAHLSLARLMKPFYQKGQKVILNPGRTFGALEFYRELGVDSDEVRGCIAETQTIIFTCRKTATDSVNIIQLKNGVLLSSLDSRKNVDFIGSLPSELQAYFIPARSIMQTSLGNIGMILHTIPVLLNTGWIEFSNVDFKYYYDGITPSIANVLQKMDDERLAIAKSVGEDVESLLCWLNRSYGVNANSIYSAIQSVEAYRFIDAPKSLQHRYIFEDIPTGLVPLEKLGLEKGVPTPVISLAINLANAVLSTDFRKIGRLISAKELRDIR